jgi:hypothetical protein
MASTKIRTGRRKRLRVSLRNTAVARASGTVITSARPTCSRLPMMACDPPPSVAGIVGVMPRWSSVKKSGRNAGRPLRIT